MLLFGLIHLLLFILFPVAVLFDGLPAFSIAITDRLVPLFLTGRIPYLLIHRLPVASLVSYILAVCFAAMTIRRCRQPGMFRIRLSCRLVVVSLAWEKFLYLFRHIRMDTRRLSGVAPVMTGLGWRP